MVMKLKLNGGKNDREKKIKGIEVTTRSKEEVLPDKENARKVVSTTNRRIKFIETSIPTNIPAPNENAPAPDPRSPKPRLEQPNKNELLDNWGASSVEPMDPIKHTVFTPQASCAEVYDYHRCCPAKVGGDFISFRETKHFTPSESSARESPSTTISFQNSIINCLPNLNLWLMAPC
jgi:hypothetical protein